MCCFDGIRRGNYFGGVLIGRTEVEVRVGKLKNGKAVGKDEITGEMKKSGGDRVVDRSEGYILWPLRVVLCLRFVWSMSLNLNI